MENKYYTPTIAEFHVGFEYEYNEENIYDEREWEPYIFSESDIWTWNKPPTKKCDGGFKCQLLDGNIRVKYLDKSDIESLGFEEWDINKKSGDRFDTPKYNNFTEASFTGGTNSDGNLFGATIFYGNVIDPTFIRIEGAVSPGPVYGYIGGEPIFKGSIKNKSELKRLLKQLGINK